MDVTLIIKPGAGGEESADFASILTKMYRKWGQRHGLVSIETTDYDKTTPSEYKMTLHGVEDGKLNGEHGIHRLCRLSPFDAQNRRHTSFASVEVSGVGEVLGKVRNYVLQPYQQAEDYKKRYTTEHVSDILEGGVELDKIMEAPVGLFDIPGAPGAMFERRTLTQKEMDYALTLKSTIEP